MIFAPDLAEKVLRGTKTVTRRPIKDGEARCRYIPLRSYAIQPGRGKSAIGRIWIVQVTGESLGHLSDEEARREGFRTGHDFEQRWLWMYGGPYDPEQLVWRIVFELSKAPTQEATQCP